MELIEDKQTAPHREHLTVEQIALRARRAQVRVPAVGAPWLDTIPP